MKSCAFVIALLLTLLFIFSMNSYGSDKTINCTAIKVDGLWTLNCIEKETSLVDEMKEPAPVKKTKYKTPLELLLGTQL